jgi:hypothetical protein
MGSGFNDPEKLKAAMELARGYKTSQSSKKYTNKSRKREPAYGTWTISGILA